MIGFSQGAITALAAVGSDAFDLFEPGDRKFKAAIAFYPSCLSDGTMTVPTLILIGALDDWTRASACTAMMANRTGAGSPVRLIVYPGAHHAFDVTSLQPGRSISAIVLNTMPLPPNRPARKFGSSWHSSWGAD